MCLIIFNIRLSEGGEGWVKRRGKCGVWLPPDVKDSLSDCSVTLFFHLSTRPAALQRQTL